VLGAEQGRRLELVEPAPLRVRMREQCQRGFLENRGDGDHFPCAFGRLEQAQRIGSKRKIDPALLQGGAAVSLRSARHDGDVEAVAFIGAVGERLKKSTLPGSGRAVEAERHLVEALIIEALIVKAL